jgi:hypothetical protein
VPSKNRAADDVGEGHRQVRLPLGALVLVLLEDHRVEGRAALVEPVEAFSEPGDSLCRCQREGEPDAPHHGTVSE